MSQPRLTRRDLFIASESQLQDQIVEGLERMGYVCLQVGRWVRQAQCPRCKAWSTPRCGHGNTPGSPDLFVTHPDWGKPARWIGMEIKTPTVRTLTGTLPGGRLRKEQKALAEMGLIAVVRSWEEAEAAIREVTT